MPRFHHVAVFAPFEDIGGRLQNQVALGALSVVARQATAPKHRKDFAFEINLCRAIQLCDDQRRAFGFGDRLAGAYDGQ